MPTPIVSDTLVRFAADWLEITEAEVLNPALKSALRKLVDKQTDLTPAEQSEIKTLADDIPQDSAECVDIRAFLGAF